jgi:outer membrane receptor for ferrienterochelin and colicins
MIPLNARISDHYDVFVLMALAIIGFSVVTAAGHQDAASISIAVTHDGAPVQGASVTVGGTAHETDASGRATVKVVPGAIDILVAKAGYAPAAASITTVAGRRHEVTVELESTAFEETITVAATRTGKRLEDQPLRVEVLAREEIEEKMLMTPGDIVMMLNETGGLRVQATSPSLGAASVRIQGMRGRYTRFLSDGLPLFGEVGGLGLLQIPPMDLGQVEVIKGVASSLHGAGAMGGVVNLLSRRPGAERQMEVLLNRSMLGATDAVGFFSAPLSPSWGLTVLGGGHWQELMDVDEDGWSDLPGYQRGVFRPRLFWDNQAGSSVFATVGATVEDRDGGTTTLLPQVGAPYVESLQTRRIDAGLLAQTVRRGHVWTARLAANTQRHAHRYGEVLERDRHQTIFGEVAVRGTAGPHTWVAGAALEVDSYDPRDLPQFEYSYTIPGVFVQDDVDIARWLSVSASARLDHHSEYGTFVSPRLAALLRSDHWNSRISFGTGFFGPSAITEETEAAGLSRLVIPRALKAERGRSASFDVTRDLGSLSLTVTVFASRVADPIRVSRDASFELINADQATTNSGAEGLATWRQEPFALTASYTYVRSRELDGDVRVESPLTPRHSAGLVGFWEREGVGRVGVEVYYTGVQRLEANPFAVESRAYVITGLLAERRFGKLRVFVNGENLTDVRQTRWQPLIRPGRAADGRWTVDAWAPLEGRNVNAGVRIDF